MARFSDHAHLGALIPIILIWGCFGGICFAAVCFITYEIGLYSSVSCFSATVLPLLAPWIFGTAILLSLVWGMIAADLFCTGRKTDLHPVLLGLLSGICTALVGYMLVDFFHIWGYTWIWPNGPLDELRRFVGWRNDLIVYFIVLAIPQVFGAWYQASRQKSKGDTADTTSSPKGITGTRHRHWFFLVALLISLLVIPMSIYVLPVDETRYCGSGDSCAGSDSCGREEMPEFDNVTVSRTGPDSIRVSLKASSKNCGSRNSFKILLNGFDISNQDLISKTGLNVTITPREGLGRQDGAAATLQGSDITVNETSPPHIQVAIIIPDIPAPFVQRDLYL